MKTTSNTFYCPYCGAECDKDDRETLEKLNQIAEKIKYSVRCKAGYKGVYEVLNDRGLMIAEGTDVKRIGYLLETLCNPIFDEVKA